MAINDPWWLQSPARKCLGFDTNLFFPEHDTLKGQIKTAQAICYSCPFRRECLEWAVSANMKYGIWGGSRFGTDAPYRVKKIYERICTSCGEIFTTIRSRQYVCHASCTEQAQNKQESSRQNVIPFKAFDLQPDDVDTSQKTANAR